MQDYLSSLLTQVGNPYGFDTFLRSTAFLEGFLHGNVVIGGCLQAGILVALYFKV